VDEDISKIPVVTKKQALEYFERALQITSKSVEASRFKRTSDNPLFASQLVTTLANVLDLKSSPGGKELSTVTMITFQLSTETVHILGDQAELIRSDIPRGATLNGFYRSLLNDTSKFFNFFMTVMSDIVSARLFGLQSGLVSTWCLLVFKAGE
jgi:hypothetical protein